MHFKVLNSITVLMISFRAAMKLYLIRRVTCLRYLRRRYNVKCLSSLKDINATLSCYIQRFHTHTHTHTYLFTGNTNTRLYIVLDGLDKDYQISIILLYRTYRCSLLAHSFLFATMLNSTFCIGLSGGLLLLQFPNQFHDPFNCMLSNCR